MSHFSKFEQISSSSNPEFSDNRYFFFTADALSGFLSKITFSFVIFLSVNFATLVFLLIFFFNYFYSIF